MLRYLICLIIVMNMSCSTNQNENALNEIIESMGAEFPNIVKNPEKHRLQILYTQINRNQKNEPKKGALAMGRPCFKCVPGAQWPFIFIRSDRERERETKSTDLTLSVSTPTRLPTT